ncbi:MAG TPA: ABC transporter ATP-binding protein [Candidatus Cloacimonadota bacterium]|nr:ABC transporter ATP-binding protein [Candidatus Cloacimonadota bacterium]
MILEIQSLRKEFKGFTLQNVSFSMEEGCITGLIGRNGAGKTTIIKLIMGLLLPTAGTFKLFGEENRVSLRDRIGFVYEENYFPETSTLKQLKSITKSFYTEWDETVFQKYARRFNLPLEKKLKALSSGTRKKFSLALALSHHAELLIFDEPTSGLDPVMRREFLDILKEYIEDGRRSVLFSTHITTDLEQIADYIVFIDEGKIITDAPKDELLDKYRLIKGRKEDWTSEIQELCCGGKLHEFGFEALTEHADLIAKKIAIQSEKASLENIMFYLLEKKDV